MQKETFSACDIKQRETFASNVAQNVSKHLWSSFLILKNRRPPLSYSIPNIFFRKKRPAKSFYDTQFDFRAVAKCEDAKTRHKFKEYFCARITSSKIIGHNV